MRYIVGAYAASPGQAPWDPSVEADYLARVAAIPGLRGLELPFTGQLHQDEGWLLDHLDPAWDLVVTAIPGTAVRGLADPRFGLASPDPDGRRAALAFTSDLHAAVRRVHDRLGRAAVIGVELHSAPKGWGTANAFAGALTEVAGWDWDGAALTVEDCDAYRPGQEPQKGFLSLSDELAVAAKVDGIAGITVNWGRSAIEGRGEATPGEHIASAVEAGALVGLMFSGAAAVPGPFGPAWLDAHLPPSGGPTVADPAVADPDPAAADPDATHPDAAHPNVAHPDVADLTAVEPTSLMGPRQIDRALRAARGTQMFTGVKVGVRPLDLPPDQRIAYLHDAVRLVDRVHHTIFEG